MFYNPTTGKRYSEQTLKRALGDLENVNWRELGIYPLSHDIEGKDAIFYNYYENGIVGTIHEGFSLKWEKRERPLEEIKTTLSGMVAGKRYSVETGGIEFGGKKIITDRDSQYMISGAVNAVNLDPTRVIKFKTGEGFVELDSSAIVALATAVANHVQDCFSREADLVAAINSATTFAELKTIHSEEINKGWPV